MGQMWSRNEDWIGTEVEDSFVMVNIDSGKYVALNATALAIWDALETSRSAEAVSQRLVAEFDVAPEVCAASVSEALVTMRALDLVMDDEAAE